MILALVLLVGSLHGHAQFKSPRPDLASSKNTFTDSSEFEKRRLKASLSRVNPARPVISLPDSQAIQKLRRIVQFHDFRVGISSGLAERSGNVPTEQPMPFTRLTSSGSVSIGMLPLRYTAILTTEQSPANQPMNMFRAELDLERLKALRRQKLDEQISSLEKEINYKQLRAFDTLKTADLANSSELDKLKKAGSDKLEKQVKDAVNTGGDSANALADKADDTYAKPGSVINKTKAAAKSVNGRLNILKGGDYTKSLEKARDSLEKQQPERMAKYRRLQKLKDMRKIQDAPGYKDMSKVRLQKLNIGTDYPTYNRYFVNGIPVQGAHIKAGYKHFDLAVSAGNSQAQNVISNKYLRRMGIAELAWLPNDAHKAALHISLGEERKGAVLSQVVLPAFDDTARNLLPKANRVIGFVYEGRPAKKMKLNLAAYQSHTHLIPPVAETPFSGPQTGNAFSGTVQQNLNSLTGRLEASRVSANYYTFGNVYLRSNWQGLNLTLSKTLKGNLSLSGNSGAYAPIQRLEGSPFMRLRQSSIILSKNSAEGIGGSTALTFSTVRGDMQTTTNYLAAQTLGYTKPLEHGSMSLQLTGSVIKNAQTGTGELPDTMRNYYTYGASGKYTADFWEINTGAGRTYTTTAAQLAGSRTPVGLAFNWNLGLVLHAGRIKGNLAYTSNNYISGQYLLAGNAGFDYTCNKYLSVNVFITNTRLKNTKTEYNFKQFLGGAGISLVL